MLGYLLYGPYWLLTQETVVEVAITRPVYQAQVIGEISADSSAVRMATGFALLSLILFLLRIRGRLLYWCFGYVYETRDERQKFGCVVTNARYTIH